MLLMRNEVEVDDGAGGALADEVANADVDDEDAFLLLPCCCYYYCFCFYIVVATLVATSVDALAVAYRADEGGLHVHIAL